MKNVYLEKMKLTLWQTNEEIKNNFEQKRKENEIDVSKVEKNPIDRIDPEEFKKYSESFSPYPFFLYAYKNWASDLKFLAIPNGNTKVQMKIDWIWSNEFEFHQEKHILYVNATKNWLVKGSWNVNTENQRIPQDWKWVFHVLKWDKTLEKTIQLRAAFAPQHISDKYQNPLESVVIRLLWWAVKLLLENSWFSKYDYEKITSLKYMKKWLILISWPTGSWKSTTLFSFIHQLNDWTKNIYTLENPVEFDVPWITQLDVQPIEDIPDNDEITFNFERWKKFLMRWAWDAILVWEIRDYTTALTAVQMADTWHITLWTLHTKSAIATISRYLWFESWGKNSKSIERVSLIELLQYVSAQMLPPKLCPHCKIKVKDIPLDSKWKVNTWNSVFDKVYLDMLHELSAQNKIIKKEFLHNNIKKILPWINEKTIDALIQNSCLPNLKGCNKCNINKNESVINPRSWYKGVQMINESLIFDSYVTDLLLDDNFKKENLLDNLLNVRPLLPSNDKNSIKEKKQFFFTMYQDALFKALLPLSNLKNVMWNVDNANVISLLDAKIHWYIE